MASLCIVHMTRDEVLDCVQELAWEPAAKVALHSSRKEEHLARTRGESTAIRGDRKFELLRRSERKEQNRAQRLVQVAQHSSVGTRDATAADQEDQGDASRARAVATSHPVLNLGRHWEKNFESVWSRQTVLRVGSANSCGRGCVRVSTAEEDYRIRGTVPGSSFESCEFTAQKDAQPPGGTNGATGCNGSTAENNSEIERTLNTLNE